MGKLKTMNMVLICLMAFLAGCLSNNADSTKISVAGSTTVLPVISKAAEEYKNVEPDVLVLVSAGGSGVGVRSVGSGLVDIGMISRDISEAEREEFKDVDFKEFVVGRDAVAVMVSSKIYDSGVTSLSFEQLKGIYSGEIENWAEVGGPDREIFVIDKEAARGTRHVFMKAVFGEDEAEARGADIIIGSNNEGQTAVVQSDAGITTLSLAWESDDVKIIGIEINGEVIRPTLETIINNKYPIFRDLVLITSGEPAGKVKEFIEFVLGEKGQNIVEDSGYVAVN
ncbi:MAG: phosphate ABC transporter substrate-binding protein [Candidatus Hydrothermarchaeaceae archaeon]